MDGRRLMNCLSQKFTIESASKERVKFVEKEAEQYVFVTAHYEKKGS